LTAGDIVRAAMTVTGEDGLPPLPRSKLVDAVIGPVVKHATDRFLADLDGVTVDDLCREAESKSAAEASLAADFSI
jgi:Rrf2 family transcriptional regulator, iron-sulfur cluster assembly transcription factor